MPILDRDNKTISAMEEESPLMFSVRCDCCGEGQTCHQIDFSLEKWIGSHPYSLFISLLPKKHPFNWRARLELIWGMLIHGKFKYNDDMIVDVEVIYGLRDRFEKATKIIEEENRKRGTLSLEDNNIISKIENGDIHSLLIDIESVSELKEKCEKTIKILKEEKREEDRERLLKPLEDVTEEQRIEAINSMIATAPKRHKENSALHNVWMEKDEEDEENN